MLPEVFAQLDPPGWASSRPRPSEEESDPVEVLALVCKRIRKHPDPMKVLKERLQEKCRARLDAGEVEGVNYNLEVYLGELMQVELVS